ncbi:VMAP-C domain-containing protein [Amycolatopsis sp. NPDC004747]
MGPEPIARLVAAHVRRLRRERGWSADRLARACADIGQPTLTRGTIAKIESGVRKTVTADEIAVLAKALEVTPAELLAPGDEDQRPPAAAGPLGPLVDALARTEVLREPSVRALAIDLLRRQLGAEFEVPELPSFRLHLYALVVACERHPYGIQALLDVLEELEPDPSGVESVRTAAADLSPIALLPSDERAQLFRLFAAGQWVRLEEDYRAAAGPYAPEPEEPPAGPREYFEELERLNAPPSGIPPALVFVERLAAQAEPRLADGLRRWNRDLAARLQVPVPAVTEPAGTVAPASAYLIIRLEPDFVAPELLQARSWTQLGSEGLRAGEEFEGGLAEVRELVAGLVREAEAGWAADTAAIRVEFLLPRALLGLPIDQWPSELPGESPQPLGLRHQVVVRSLDRMRSPHWHRAWRRRWASLAQVGSLANDQVWWTDAREQADVRRLDARLATSDQVLLVLAQPLVAAASIAGDEVAVGLRAGVPAMLWLRDPRFSAEFREIVPSLLETGRNLPESVRLLRGAAFGADDPETHVGSHVTLLWDDPGRLVEPSGPVGVRQHAKEGRS